MHDLCSVLARGSGPQKKVPTSVAGCWSASDAKMRFQFGRPYLAPRERVSQLSSTGQTVRRAQPASRAGQAPQMRDSRAWATSVV